MCSKFKVLLTFIVVNLAGCAGIAVEQPAPPSPKVSPAAQAVAKPKPRIALVLGGGAARGFAHVGVIKTLEAQGIVPDMVVGTSAGSVVGSLYAAGYNGFALQKIAFKLEEATVTDWTFPDRGFVKGAYLEDFVNNAVKNRPIERLERPFAAVATDLQTGEPVIFRRGNTGQAVRASSSVPGVFRPTVIEGREYVDGGLTYPIPVEVARSMGADIVIAVDISARPRFTKVSGSLDLLLQTFSIMGQRIGQVELAGADVVIRPQTGTIGAADFDQKHLAIMEGEQAALAAIPAIREKIARFQR